MPPGTVWLVRHAATEWTGRRWCGRSDPPLTTAGSASASDLASRLAIEVPDGAVIVTSPLRRSLATADAIAAAIAAPVRVDPDLIEVDVGVADGMTWDELAAGHPALAEAILGRTDVDWPGGETAAQVAVRARSAAERIGDLARNGAVVVVSHGGLLHALARAMGTAVPGEGFEPASAARLDAIAAR